MKAKSIKIFEIGWLKFVSTKMSRENVHEYIPLMCSEWLILRDRESRVTYNLRQTADWFLQLSKRFKCFYLSCLCFLNNLNGIHFLRRKKQSAVTREADFKRKLWGSNPTWRYTLFMIISHRMCRWFYGLQLLSSSVSILHQKSRLSRSLN